MEVVGYTPQKNKFEKQMLAVRLIIDTEAFVIYIYKNEKLFKKLTKSRDAVAKKENRYMRSRDK